MAATAMVVENFLNGNALFKCEGIGNAVVKRIRNIHELPEWFELEKYKGVESLDTTGWYEQLSVRSTIQSMIAPRWNGKTKFIQQEIDVISAVQAMPIIDVTATDLLKCYFFGGPLPELKASDPQYSLGVHLATVRDLYLMEANIYSEVRRTARAWSAECSSGKDWLSKRNKNFNLDYVSMWAHDPVNKHSDDKRPLVRINTDLPDSVLIEQFKQMLRSMRDPAQEEFYPVRDHRKPDFSSWITFGVLPFLDLRIWARMADVQIPNRVMADAIFKPGEGGEEVVRKTTTKLADDLVKSSHLTMLASLAAYEIAERNTA